MIMLMLLNGKVRGMVGGGEGLGKTGGRTDYFEIRNKNAFITSSDAP